MTSEYNGSIRIGSYAVDINAMRQPAPDVQFDERTIVFQFRVFTEILATKRPMELATILNTSRNRQLFYLHSHGGRTKDSEWYYAQHGAQARSVKGKLQSVKAGGALICACNPGKYVLDNLPFPVLYPMDSFNMLDVSTTPDLMVLYVPADMNLPTPSEALDIVTNYLDSLFEYEMAESLKAKSLGTEFIEEVELDSMIRRLQFDRMKKETQAVLSKI